ncbi:MAG: flippase-like domain-containing protein [Parcubacteria group bacterium]|nr:flippase-like domain-containing protein [Parcubacteria group bacterium]
MPSNNIFKKAGKYAVSVAVAAAIFYFLSRRISFGQVAAVFRGVDWSLIAAAFAAYLAVNFFRAWRFYFVLGGKAPLGRLYNIASVHAMINNILPARTGELSYVYLIRKNGGVSDAENVYSLIVSRVFDMLTASGLVMLSVFFVSYSLQNAREAAALAMFGFLAVALLFLAFVFWEKRLFAAAEAVARFLTLDRFAVVGRFLAGFGEVTAKLADVRRYENFVKLSYLSVFLWILIFLMFWLTFLALGLEISFWQSVFVVAFPAAVSLLPVQPIGGFGAYEASAMLGLMMLGFDKETAFAAGLASHVITLLFSVIAGIIGYVFILIYRRRRNGNNGNDSL